LPVVHEDLLNLRLPRLPGWLRVLRVPGWR